MSVAASIFHGDLPFILSGPTFQSGGNGQLDAVTFELLTGRNWQEDAQALGFVEGRPIGGYASMWVDTIHSTDEGVDCCTVQVGCVGLRQSGNKMKRSLSCAGRQVAIGPFERVILVWEPSEKGETTTGEAVEKVKRRVPKLDSAGEVIYKTIATPSGTSTRWNIKEPILTARYRYFSTVKLPSDVAGTAQTPPNPPTPPPYQWAGYAEPMRGNHPNGWVLDERQEEEHFVLTGGQGLWEYEDVYEFYYILSPE